MGITPLVLGSAPFPNFNPGRQLVDGNDVNTIGALLGSAESGKTATASGTQLTSYPIKAANTQITVVATAADGVVLPPATYPGLRCAILNSDAADALTVFASGNDTINATAGATGVSLAAGAAAMFLCIVAGNWRRFLSA